MIKEHNVAGFSSGGGCEGMVSVPSDWLVHFTLKKYFKLELLSQSQPDMISATFAHYVLTYTSAALPGRPSDSVYFIFCPLHMKAYHKTCFVNAQIPTNYLFRDYVWK